MTKEYVRVATDKLHAHANYVRGAQSRVWHVAKKVENGGIPVTAWGVPDATSTADSGKPGGWDYSGNPAEALRRAKEAYEKAHRAAVDRLYELSSIYGDTAEGLDTVADNYDIADMREARARSRNEQEAR